MSMEQAKRNSEQISGVSNVTYDLIAVLHNELDAIAAMEGYKQDARDAGNQEVERFFDQCQRNARANVEQLRGLLGQQLQGATADRSVQGDQAGVPVS